MKFPTFKLRIINDKNSTDKISIDKLEKLLKRKYNYEIYYESNVVKISSLDHMESIAIHFLESNLRKNEQATDEIKNVLNSNNIFSEKCVAYGLYPIPITIGEDGYIKVFK